LVAVQHDLHVALIEAAARNLRVFEKVTANSSLSKSISAPAIPLTPQAGHCHVPLLLQHPEQIALESEYEGIPGSEGAGVGTC